MSHAIILEHLQGATAQSPVSLDELASKTGLLPDAINQLLDQMVHCVPAAVNKIKSTKDGKTQVLVWPTGAVKPRPKRVHLRIGKSESAAPTAQEEETESGRHSNVDVVRYVIEHPGCTQVEVADNVAGMARRTRCRLNVMVNDCVKRGYLARRGRTLTMGDNVAWLQKNGLLALAAMIEQIGAQERLNQEREAAPPETVQPIGAEEIPRFVKQPEPDSPVYYVMKNTEDKLRQAMAAIYEELPAGGDISIARLIDGELSINYHMFGMDDIIEIGDDIDHLAEVIRAHRTLNKHRSAA